jgi:serine/threonine-protein kinase RsbT
VSSLDAGLAATREERLPTRSDADVVAVRQRVRQLTIELRFSLVEQTKMVTAASELARNTLEHGGGGEVVVAVVSAPPRRGHKLVSEDAGPGIADVQLALRDGYTTGNGLGLGLGGARRLVNDFDVDSAPGRGTRVTAVRWK